MEARGRRPGSRPPRVGPRRSPVAPLHGRRPALVALLLAGAVREGALPAGARQEAQRLPAARPREEALRRGPPAAARRRGARGPAAPAAAPAAARAGLPLWARGRRPREARRRHLAGGGRVGGPARLSAAGAGFPEA